MKTVGIDLAAEPARTAAVIVEWTDGQAEVADVVSPADDDTIVSIADCVDRIGIDCPLGWPENFVDFVVAHRTGAVATAADSIAARRPLVFRATDLHCMAAGHRPLSVAADRIAHAALRAAALLARLGETDRSGTGRVVEAYPAGSLRSWALPHRGYKNDPAVIAASLDEIAGRIGLCFADGTRARCETSDHAFDALVVAVTARAAALGRVEPPPAELARRARREGWICLPDPALEELRG